MDSDANDVAPLSVTEEQLFAIIGRLHVENMVLRARLAERATGMPPLFGTDMTRPIDTSHDNEAPSEVASA